MKRMIRYVLFMFIVSFSNLYAQNPPTIQAVYNVADPALSSVDFYIILVGVVFDSLPNVAYQNVTGTLASPIAGLPITIGVAPGNSGSVEDTIKSFSVFLENDKNFMAIGAGVVDPAQFAANPDGRDIGIEAFIIDDSRLESSVSGDVQFVITHGVTDAPTVDVRLANGGATLVNDLAYGDFSEYVSLTPGEYTLEVVDQNDQLLGKFRTDLSAYRDSALVVALSGFLDPSANQNGPEFSMFGGTRGSTKILFEKLPIVGIGDDSNPVVTSYRLEQNYPNPFNPSTTIAFALPNAGQVKLAIYDITGKLVDTIVDQPFGAGVHQVKWEAGNIPSGVYFYQLETINFTQTRKLMLLK